MSEAAEPPLPEAEQPPAAAGGRSYDQAHFLALVAFLVLVILVFSPTLFAGKSISRVDLLCHWDTLFAGYSGSAMVGIEPSSILFIVPYFFFVAGLWRQGEVPLWNSLSEFGCPLLADPESAVFSIFQIPLLLSPTFYTYNCTLVLKLLVMGLGTFFLARRLGLGALACGAAALTMAFCPYNQWYLELIGNGYCLTPFLFFAFTRLAFSLRESGAKKLSPQVAKSALWSGFTAAVMILSAHIEISFCAIFAVSLWTLLLGAFPPQAGDMPAKLPAQRLLLGFLALTISGATAFFLAAPMLLPFLEFLCNSESYKFGAGNPSYVSFLALLLSFSQPVYGGASPYLGFCAFAFLPLALFYDKDNRTAKGVPLAKLLLGLNLFLIGLSCRVLPVSLLFKVKPFSFIVANYYLHIVVLLSAILAAMGFDWLLKKEKKDWVPFLAAIAAGLFACLIRPFLSLCHFSLSSLSFDDTLPAASFSNYDFYAALFSCLALLLLLALLRMSRCAAREALRRFAAVSILIVWAASLLCLSKPALPLRQAFAYPDAEPLPSVKASGSRVVACGSHILKPNINLCYGIRDIRALNAIFPERYLSFMDKLGAQITSFNVGLDLPVSGLLRLTSVKNILSGSPVYDAAGLNRLAMKEAEAALPLDFGSGIMLRRASFCYEPRQSAVFGKLALQAPEPVGKEKKSARPGFQAYLLDSQKNVVALCERRSFRENASYSLSVPLKLKAGSRLQLYLQIFDKNGAVLGAPVKLAEFLSDQAVGQNFEQVQAQAQAPLGYKLIAESPSGVRLYEMAQPLSDAYLVRRYHFVDSKQEALEWLSDTAFDWQSVVLERSEPGVRALEKDYIAKTSANVDAEIEDVAVQRRGQSLLQLEVELSKPAVLVLTDINYPGWKAYIDGQEAPLLHGNYAFRALALTTGKHRVEMRYQPLSFYVGVGLFFTFCILLLILLLGRGFRVSQRACKSASKSH
ncbi:MAG: YfhO family protein [Candidatus Obscuribacter phosphatis]|uniref:YfhO family protein n=1 Tax=Candidatus Obscuribacter phosphatis TaxID=1906157 RepID=A0A8J7PDZ3_9BACT|nr:YfhO family protein [Candidatus Obscuribacter phosphatis]